MMVVELTRRQFLAGGTAALVGLSLSRLTFAAGAAGAPAPQYSSWQDVYRKRWQWDKIVRSSHECNCNNACSWTVYVRDGIVWREEQTAAYPQTIAGLPDFNPQGCQKGASFSHEMYAPSRVRHPLKRVGERGSGRWQRVSWDEALGDIATRLIEIVRDDGHDTIIASQATHAAYMNKGGPAKSRFIDLVGGVYLDTFGEIGDAHCGAMITTGHQTFDGGSDTRLYSRCIMLWVYNPAVTRIPDAHHLQEARYNGATIIAVSPDQSPSHLHADIWVNPRPGTDTAVALAMAHIIVRDRLYDEAHMKEQTDLPFLVREDNARFLRAADLEADGGPDEFYVWDLRSGQPVKAPGTMGSPVRSLRLEAIDPALEGSWQVRVRGGEAVTVRPVFERLKTVLERHSPRFAREASGVGEQTIERITREYATRKPALIQWGWGIGKLYDGDLLGRALILLSALTGNTGRVGGGYWSGGILPQEGMMAMMPVLMKTGRHRIVCGTTWLYVHGGLREFESRWIPTPGAKTGDEYIMEAIEKKWMPVYPAPGKEPRALIECGSNILRRTRMHHVLEESMWPKLRLVVSIDLRMSATAMKSDYVLPAAGYYETEGVKYADTKIPYHVYKGKAVEPLGEAHDEWWIFASLCRKIQELAPRMGVTVYRDEDFGIDRDLSRIYDEYTEQGRWPEDADGTAMLEHLLGLSEAYRDVSLPELREKGIVHWDNVGSKDNPGVGMTSDYERGQPFTAATDFTEKKTPWKTLTGRQQFYIDHDWFLEFGEELPVFRAPPKMGGEHPLRLTCGHTRWGIHSLWRTDPLMLQLQRGEPIIYMNPRDGTARGIGDDDLVEVFNDVGSFQVKVMLTPTMQPGQIHVQHAWEPYQFKGWRSYEAVMASQVKPLNCVGDYGHLRYLPTYYQPNNVDKGTTVDVRKV